MKKVPTYVILTTLTAKGRITVGAKPERVAEVNKEIEKMGVKIIRQYAVLGPYDFINIAEAPDNETVARMSVALGARGTVTLMSLPAIPMDEFVTALKKKK